MQKQKSLDSTVPASIGKSLFAFLIDFLCSLGVMLAIYFGIAKPLIGRSNNIDGIYNDYNKFQSDSFLVGEDSKALSFPSYDKKSNTYGYKKYEEVVWKYYTVFVATNPNATFFEDDEFLGDKNNPIEVGKWVYNHIYKLEENNEKEDSFYNSPTETTDYTLAPTLKQSYLDLLEAEKNNDKTETADKLLNYYYQSKDNSVSGLYVDCVKHFSSQPYAEELTNKYSSISYWIWLPGILISPFIFFFIFPLCISKGRTVGKLILSIGLANKNGEEASKGQIAIHYAILTLLWYILALPINMNFSFMIVGTALLIDFIVLLLSKNHQSIHDKIASTEVVDLKLSTIYPSSLSKEEKIEEKEEIKEDNYFNKPLKREEKEEEPSFEVLDSRTIGQARKQAEKIKSFDEFENK
ncbi:MAG TPA: hypothetical protein DCR94_06190 [Firmicutes bacterium]|nr:hypothetical protein [Bacillota bacterium]